MLITDDREIFRLIEKAKTIAVLGLSNEPERASFAVAKYMQQQGFRIIPVNPKYSEILGERCYADLASVPVAVDIVDCFRQSQYMPDVARDLKSMQFAPQVLWMQLEIVSQEAADIATAQGIKVVMNRCLKIEHAKMLRAKA